MEYTLDALGDGRSPSPAGLNLIVCHLAFDAEHTQQSMIAGRAASIEGRFTGDRSEEDRG
jgi:hypothetical protein